jgi:hypothetical protein
LFWIEQANVMKIDFSQVTKGLAKLAFVKNYSAYLWPAALTAVALLLLVPAGVLSSSLRSTIQKESVSKGKAVDSLASQRISAQQWEIERQYQEALAADANAMDKLARQSSQRELLSYSLFPQPKDTSVQIFEEFGRRYRSGIENIIKDAGARQCPTQAEIDRALRQSGTQGAQTGAIGTAGNISFSLGSMGKVEQMIIDELCRSVARNASFYAAASDMAGYGYWGKGDGSGTEGSVYSYQSIQQSVEACWYWQLGYWIIEDVFASIRSANSGCASVMDCPVKRLVGVSFSPAAAGSFRSIGPGTVAASGPPQYVTLTQKGLTASYTGRVCNEQWDVVDFRVTVVLSARSVLPFIDELCSAKEHTFRGWDGTEPPQTCKHNQITVLATSIEPVVSGSTVPGRSAGTEDLYRYGNDAVVKMDLTCEYIFERAGYDQIKPESIKNELLNAQ